MASSVRDRQRGNQVAEEEMGGRRRGTDEGKVESQALTPPDQAPGDHRPTNTQVRTTRDRAPLGLFTCPGKGCPHL